MKKKKSKKISQENPNQLSLEFLYKEPSIDVHIPKSASTVFNTTFYLNKKIGYSISGKLIDSFYFKIKKPWHHHGFFY